MSSNRSWEEVDDFQQRADEIILEINPPVDANEQQLHVLCEQLDSLKLDISACFKMLIEKTDSSSKTLNSDSVKAYNDILKGVQISVDKDLHSTLAPRRTFILQT